MQEKLGLKSNCNQNTTPVACAQRFNFFQYWMYCYTWKLLQGTGQIMLLACSSLILVCAADLLLFSTETEVEEKKNRTEKPCSCNNDYSPARVKRCWDTNKKLYISNALQEIKATQSVIVNAAPFEKGQNKLSAVQRIPFKNNRGKMATAICIMTGPNRIIIRDCLCMLHCCLMKMQPFICRLQD